MNDYTIIATNMYYGQIIEPVAKEKVRSECKRIKKILSIGQENTYQRIEVVNNQTGEIREFWNNHDNIIQF